jgi:sulfur-oxidizing protein SoxY
VLRSGREERGRGGCRRGPDEVQGVRQAADGSANAPREAQVMIRHPNNSGLQRDQVSLLYIPANFVDELHVWQGDALLFA